MTKWPPADERKKKQEHMRSPTLLKIEICQNQNHQNWNRKKKYFVPTFSKSITIRHTSEEEGNKSV